MRTILVDDEQWVRDTFAQEARDIPELEVVGVFSNARQALEYVREHPVDFALLDIEMPGMNGVELGKRLRELMPDLVIIYATSYPQYTTQAMLDVKADHYILKPYFNRELRDAVDRARRLATRIGPRISIVAFGRFDVYCDGRLVSFPNAKSKELLALCVDHRGGSVSLEEALDKLWGCELVGDNERSYYRRAMASLKALFSELGEEDVVKNQRGSCHIDVNAVRCDYFDYLRGAPGVEFLGEYMSSYSWAEETLSRLVWHKYKQGGAGGA